MVGAKFLIKKLRGPAMGDRNSGWLTLPIQMPHGWTHWDWHSLENKDFRLAAAKAAKEKLPSVPNLVPDPADKGTMKGCKWEVYWDQHGPGVVLRPEEKGGSYISVRPVAPSQEIVPSVWEMAAEYD